MSSSSAPQLDVHEWTGRRSETRPVGPNDARFHAVHTIYNHALFLVETPQGRRALRDLGIRIVEGLKSDPNHTSLYPVRRDPNYNRMDWYIGLFLERMRDEPPEVYLTYTEGEAASVKYNWAKRDKKMEDYVPREGGHLTLHSMALDDMVTSGSRDRTKFTFIMTIAMAHEICHLFTGYLTGSERPRTPRTVQVPGAAAEAGFYWEVQVLGGIVEFYADPEDPTNVHQPGIPWLFRDGRLNTLGMKVPTSYIEDFVAFSHDPSLPALTRPDRQLNRIQLRSMSKMMTTLRVQAFGIAPSQQASASAAAAFAARNRMPLAQPEYYQYYE